MASDFDDLLSYSANVQRRTLAAGDLGAAQTENWSNVSLGLLGSLQPSGSRERVGGDAIDAETTHWWYWEAADFAIKARDRLLIGNVIYDCIGPAEDYTALSLGMKRIPLRVREES